MTHAVHDLDPPRKADPRLYFFFEAVTPVRSAFPAFPCPPVPPVFGWRRWLERSTGFFDWREPMVRCSIARMSARVEEERGCLAAEDPRSSFCTFPTLRFFNETTSPAPAGCDFALVVFDLAMMLERSSRAFRSSFLFHRNPVAS